MTLRPVAAPSPGSTSSLRAANQRRIIDALRDARPDTAVTQADLARTTQLAPATVSNIVRDLAGVGLVETIGGAGRRGTEVRISRAAGLVGAVDFGQRHLRVAIGDLGGSVLAEHRLPIVPEQAYDEALALADRMLTTLLDGLDAARADVLTVGMGLAAPLAGDGRTVDASILPGWEGVDAARAAEQTFGRPVRVDNDANLSALAEHRLGAGIGHDCLVYVKASHGLGAGMIIDGQLFRGGAGTAGEIGHVTYDESGPICRCGGRGCLEAYTSVRVLQEFMRLQHPDASVGELLTRALAGDLAVQRALEEVGTRLGWGVAILANLINPTCVVLGGDMAQAGDLLLDAVRAGVRRHALPAVARGLTVTMSALRERAAVIGALLLALDSTELGLPVAG